jgi:hypothetical protein
MRQRLRQLQEWWHEQFHEFGDGGLAGHSLGVKHYCLKCGRDYDSRVVRMLKDIPPPRLLINKEGRRVSDPPQ